MEEVPKARADWRAVSADTALAKEKGPPRLRGAALARSGPSPAGSAAGRGDQPEGVWVGMVGAVVVML